MREHETPSVSPPTPRPIGRALWLDLTVSLQDGEAASRLPDGFTIIHADSHVRANALCDAGEVDVLCLDYDYPDRSGLRVLQSLKADFPSIPIVMFTLQHSESLAVWAFRTRVWDYIVKPAPEEEVLRCFKGIEEILKKRKEQPLREAVKSTSWTPEEASAPAPTSNEVTLAPAINHIEMSFREKISVDDVAALCHVSPFRFSKLFKATYGIAFREYVLRYRLREARRMLESPAAVVTDVCYAVGFNDNSYFSRMFRKYFGTAPSALLGVEMAQGPDADLGLLPLERIAN